jgi:membrane associated rhomboid family serine protease
MGLADRHYHRDEAGFTRGSGPMNWRLWSVTTWLIVICISVFVLDTFLPPQPVVMQTRINESFSPEVVREARPDQAVVMQRDRHGRPATGQRPLVRPGPDGRPQVVGVQELRWMPFLQAHLHFSTLKGFFQVEFWRLLGFQFLHTHDTIMHLLFNMMGLFFFGPLVERELGSKRYLAFYLLCGIAGALFYTLLNVGGIAVQMITGDPRPVTFLLFSDISTPLIGASAGVFGVLIAGARLAPNATVHLFMLIPVRFGTLAWVLIGIEVFMLVTGARNAGGHAAHLGGAAAGFYFIRNPHHLHDFFDILGRMDPSSRSRRGLPREGGGTLSRARRGLGRLAGQAPPDPAEVDRILEKVFNEGLSSLTDRERKALEAARRAGDHRAG